jgi:hypothetical protein
MLRALVLLAWIPFVWQPTWGQTPGIGIKIPKKKPDNTTGSAKSPEQRGTKENPIVVDTLGHQQTPVERKEADKQAVEAKAEEQYHRDIDQWTLIWNGTTSAATAVLVLVGIGGVFAALKTLRAIERQGKLMEEQFRQALYLTNWSVRKPKNDPEHLRVRVDLINLSIYPMTLKNGSVQIGGESIELGDNTFLPPNIPMEIEIILGTPIELSAYDQGMLRLGLAAVFSHIDRISNKIISQPVYGHLECGYWGAIFHWRLHMNPIEDPEQHETKN